MPARAPAKRANSNLLKQILTPFNGSTLKIYASGVLAALTAGAIFLGVNTAIGITDEAPRITIGDGNDGVIILVPALGDEGYPVAAFCEDPNTVIKQAVVPGTADVGQTYELIRLTDGDSGLKIPEMITWSTGIDGENRLATFYYEENGEQQSATAVVDKAAEDCIKAKAEPIDD